MTANHASGPRGDPWPLATRGPDASGTTWPGERTSKKMFGGVGFLEDGNLLVGVWQDLLMERYDGWIGLNDNTLDTTYDVERFDGFARKA
jgi:hypothetical protein